MKQKNSLKEIFLPQNTPDISKFETKFSSNIEERFQNPNHLWMHYTAGAWRFLMTSARTISGPQIVSRPAWAAKSPASWNISAMTSSAATWMKMKKQKSHNCEQPIQNARKDGWKMFSNNKNCLFKWNKQMYATNNDKQLNKIILRRECILEDINPAS